MINLLDMTNINFSCSGMITTLSMSYTSLICGHMTTLGYGYLDREGGSFYPLAQPTPFSPICDFAVT